MASSSRIDSPDAYERDAAPYGRVCAAMLGTVAVALGADLRRVADGADPSMTSAIACGGLAATWARLPETWERLADGTVAGVVAELDALSVPDFARAGVPYVAISDDAVMGRMAEQGAAGMAEAVSQTTAWGNVRLRTRDGRLVPIREAYDQMLAEAARQVADGEDVQQVVRAVADQLVGQRNGLRIVRTDSHGRDRSYDITGAVRQDVWDNRSRVMQQLRGEQGRLCGMDAVEITAHATCAPDHIDAQGKIYTLDAFAKLQETLRRPIGYWNCRHITWPCWADSTPSQTPEELAEMREMSERTVTFTDDNGRSRSMTAYEFTQWQRAQERRIRDEKTRRMLYEAAGDAESARESTLRVRQMRRTYTRASAAADVRTMAERTLVGTLA